MRKFASLLVLVLLNPSGLSAAEWADVSALFAEHCVACHSGEFAPLGLQLDSHSGVVTGSENGPILSVNDADASALIGRVEGRIEPRMPLGASPLETAEIALLRDWIANGAPGPLQAEDTSSVAVSEPMADGRITYDEIAQIFGQSCLKCHSDSSVLGAPPEGLKLGSLSDILNGGDRIVVIPGNAQASELIRRVEGLSRPSMPFGEPPLPEDRIALLRAWIDDGAMDAEGRVATLPVGGSVRYDGTMSGATEIDGISFQVTPRTRVEDRLSTGDRAELRGSIGADGSIIAERLRKR